MPNQLQKLHKKWNVKANLSRSAVSSSLLCTTKLFPTGSTVIVSTPVWFHRRRAERESGAQCGAANITFLPALRHSWVHSFEEGTITAAGVLRIPEIIFKKSWDVKKNKKTTLLSTSYLWIEKEEGRGGDAGRDKDRDGREAGCAGRNRASEYIYSPPNQIWKQGKVRLIASNSLSISSGPTHVAPTVPLALLHTHTHTHTHTNSHIQGYKYTLGV